MGGDANLSRYVGNSPTLHVDPTGEFWGLGAALGGAVIGGGIGAGVSIIGQAWGGNGIDWRKVATGAAAGAAGGYVAGAIGGALLGDPSGLATVIAVGAIAGAAGGGVGGALNSALDQGIDMWDGQRKCFDIDAVIESGLIGAALGGLLGPLFGPSSGSIGDDVGRAAAAGTGDDLAKGAGAAKPPAAAPSQPAPPPPPPSPPAKAPAAPPPPEVPPAGAGGKPAGGTSSGAADDATSGANRPMSDSEAFDSSHAANSSQSTKPPISRQKQDGHVAGTSHNARRLKQGKPTSTFDCTKEEADALVQEAWEKGTDVPGRPGVKDYDFGVRIGTGPRSGGQSKVRVHEDGRGRIHGHPAGPET